MKSLKFLFLAFVALFFTWSVQAQVYWSSSFTVLGDDVAGIKADVSVEFSYTGSTHLIDITILNSSTTSSEINEFYMLKPLDGTTRVLPAKGSGVGTTWDPNWEHKDGITNEFSDLLTGPTSNYFGAAHTPPEEPDIPGNDYKLDNGESGHWTFDLGSSFNNQNIGVDWPSIDEQFFFVRWITVGDLGNDSDKGVVTGRSFDPAIPEPSEVALMSILGLGGLLWIRRRVVARK